jgi:hypothetical protein
MTWVEFEPTIPVFERAKTIHALDLVATVIGWAVIVTAQHSRIAVSLVTESHPEIDKIVIYLYHALRGATWFQGCRLTDETHFVFIINFCNILSKLQFSCTGYYSTLKMEAVYSSETLMKPYQTTRRHVLYDSALQKQAHVEANSCLSGQEIRNPKVHYHIHEPAESSLLLLPILFV